MGFDGFVNCQESDNTCNLFHFMNSSIYKVSTRLEMVLNQF